MNNKHRKILLISSLVILSNLLNIEQAHSLGINIEEGKTYEKNTDSASSAGLTAGVHMNTFGDLQIKNNTFNKNSSTSNPLC